MSGLLQKQDDTSKLIERKGDIKPKNTFSRNSLFSADEPTTKKSQYRKKNKQR